MMSRPLALTGFCALAVLLLGIHYLPSAAIMPLAVLLLVASATGLTFSLVHKKSVPAVFVLTLAAGLALLRLFGQQNAVEEIRVLADGEYHVIEGAVYEKSEGLYENVYSLELRVTVLDGRTCSPFRVVCSNAERGDVGQLLRLRVQFEEPSSVYRIGQYAKKIYLYALQEYAGEEEVLGEGQGVMLAMARLRTKLGGTFMRLGRSTGGTAAAMIVGDRSRLDPLVYSRFQDAGVAHILVVSGLHLSLLSAAVTAVYRKIFRRRWLTVLCTMLCIMAYMLLVGMTVSVVRAGVLALLALAAPLFDRTADTCNSLGLALILLLLINPYAACDLGLLLSFGATLGVLCFGTLNVRHFQLEKKGFWGRLLQMLGTTAFATLFTLPILAWEGTTLSLGTLAANMLCIPLVLPVMVVGVVFLVSHLIFDSVNLLLSGHVLYLLLRVLETIAEFVGQIFSNRLGVSGWAATLILCCAGAAAFIVYHSRLRRWCALSGVGVLLALCAVSFALNAGTVRVALVGGGINPAVVISRDGECAVLYRGVRSNLDAVQEYIQLQNLRSPRFVADLSGNDVQAAIKTELGRLDMVVPEQHGYAASTDCLDGVELLTIRQKEGVLCYITVDGYSVGVSAGPVSCMSYPACSAFLAGHSVPEGLRTDLLVCMRNVPEWARQYAAVSCYTGEEPVLWIRPGVTARVLKAEKGLVE